MNIYIPYGDNDFMRIFNLVGKLIVTTLRVDEEFYQTIENNPKIIHDYIELTLKLHECPTSLEYLTQDSAWSNFIGSNPSKYLFGEEACEYVMKHNFDFNSEALFIDMNTEQGYQII